MCLNGMSLNGETISWEPNFQKWDYYEYLEGDYNTVKKVTIGVEVPSRPSTF